MIRVFCRTHEVSKLMLVILTVCTFLVDFCSGYNGCYDSTWIYHSPSHTCLKLFKDQKSSWKDARSKCKCFDRRYMACQNSWLAVIKDEEMNRFVKGLLPTSYSSAYIGLYKDNKNKPMQWTGSIEKVTYQDFATSNDQETFYTYIRKDGWHRSDRGATRDDFICQTDANNRQMKVTCPDPVRVSPKSSENTKLHFECFFDFSAWDSVEWRDASKMTVSKCARDWRCTVWDTDTNKLSVSRHRDDTMTLVYEGKISRELGGEWSCAVSTSDTTLDERSCELLVYEPGEDITCVTDVTGGGVLATCVVHKIFPEANCYWKYKMDGNGRYVTARLEDMVDHTSTQYTDGGHTYFSTKCQLNLTKDSFSFKEGLFIIKVRMMPHLHKFTVQTEDHRFQEVDVNIELPENPVFKFINDTMVDDKQVLTYTTGDRIEIVCEVLGGTPIAYKTTVSCGTDTTYTSLSNRYILNTIATKEMDTVTCTCWGHHIVSPTPSTKIHFRILYHSEVQTFYSIPRQPAEGERVILVCQGDGVPEPDVTISTTSKIAQMNRQSSKKTLSVNFIAYCSQMGRYECQAANTIQGQVHTSSQNLDLVITCPPTSCGGHDDVPSFATRVQGEVKVTLCARGFPIPSKDKFILYKEDSPSAVSGSSYDVKVITEDKILTGVEVTFHDMQKDDMGSYKVYIPQTDLVKYSYLKFKLTTEGPPRCPDNFSVQEVGTDYVTLSWIPGYSHTGKQTFELLRISSPPSSVAILTFGKVEVEGDKVITYKVSGLTPNTDYWIGIDTRNTDGLISCPDWTLSATTNPNIQEAVKGDGGTDYTPVGVGVFLTLLFIFIIAVVIAFFLWRRKKKDQGLDDKPNIAHQATSNPTPYTGTDTQTYSNHNVTKKDEQMCENSKPDVLVDVVDKHTTEQAEEMTPYATLPIHDDGVYSNSPGVKDSEADIPDNPYSNCPEPGAGTPSQQRSIRRQKQKELNYVDVIIDPSNQRPEFKERAPQPSTEKEESVEYVSIDPVATRAAKEDESKTFTEEEEDDNASSKVSVL